MLILFKQDQFNLNQSSMIFDWIGMIGSTGGTLGLFIGFTFYDFVLKLKFLDAGIQDVSTSISIVHDLIERSPDGDEIDKHL